MKGEYKVILEGECGQCRQIVHDGVIRRGHALHSNCVKAWEAALIGKKHVCPKCNGIGQTNSDEKVLLWVACAPGETAPCAYNDCRGCGHCRQKEELGYVKVECKLCIGYGYTAAQYVPVTKQVITGYTEK